MALMFFSLFVYNLTSVAKSVLEVEAAHFFLENNSVLFGKLKQHQLEESKTMQQIHVHSYNSSFELEAWTKNRRAYLVQKFNF